VKLFRPERKVTDPEGRTWEVYVSRFSLRALLGLAHHPGHRLRLGHVGLHDLPLRPLGLDQAQREAIRRRNVLELIAAGGNIYYLAKFAGIFGLSVQDIGASPADIALYDELRSEGALDLRIYASLALALVLIHRATGVINFAQGEMATLSTYIAWTLITNHGWSYWPAFAFTLAASFVGGAAIHQGIIRPNEKGSVLRVVIVTIGLLLFINGLVTWIWGGEVRALAGVTLRRGNGQSTVSPGFGGAAFVQSGATLTLTNSAVTDNDATGGGGITAAGGLALTDYATLERAHREVGAAE